MLQHSHSIYSDTLTASTLFEAFDLVDFNDAKITTDDAPVKAVALNPATEIGLEVAGLFIGTVQVRARGAITKGSRLISAAAGGVKVAGATPANVFSTALTAAADGELVTILIR